MIKGWAKKGKLENKMKNKTKGPREGGRGKVYCVGPPSESMKKLI